MSKPKKPKGSSKQRNFTIRNLTFLMLDSWLRAAGKELRGATFTTTDNNDVVCLLVERSATPDSEGNYACEGMVEGRATTLEVAVSKAHVLWKEMKKAQKEVV